MSCQFTGKFPSRSAITYADDMLATLSYIQFESLKLPANGHSS